MKEVSIFWYRRDLRLHDNTGLYHALRGPYPVVPLFIFDRNILDDLEERGDRRVQFIHQELLALRHTLEQQGSSLKACYGTPLDIFRQLLREYTVRHVFTNHDYEPYAIDRDRAIRQLLEANGISFTTYKDQVIFEKDEVLKDDGSPYTVFTPYSRKWKSLLTDFTLRSYPAEKYRDNFLRQAPQVIPSLGDMGFREAPGSIPPKTPGEAILVHYDRTRDFPGVDGTTRLGIHLRFGTISIRKLASKAREVNAVLLNELIWREFYAGILWHFPRVGRHQAFKPAYDNIQWRNNETEFGRWCRGETGFPIVDAGMRQLNQTGYMHNRVRMIVASFLVKDLLIDWRWGEAYFAGKLLDFDLASNNGGWQWAAGSGCDAAPYFRVFNPDLQTRKFDPGQEYIRKWVPEFETPGYPEPMVDHAAARERCLRAYRAAVGSG